MNPDREYKRAYVICYECGHKMSSHTEKGCYVIDVELTGSKTKCPCKIKVRTELDE